MKAQWKLVSEKVASLSQREKVLLLISGLILIPGMLDFFLIQPLRESSNRWQVQTQTINERMTSFNTQQEALLAEISNDPAMLLERRIEGMGKALDKTKKTLISYTDSLISPQKMASMLESMLHERGDLKLVSLENLPVAPLFNKQASEQQTNSTSSKDNSSKDYAENERANQPKKDVFGLYRHGIRLIFKGNYMSTMNYLQSLEQLPWKFYWQHFDYQVEKHPNALITLNIYTLSTNRWWIGDEDE